MTHQNLVLTEQAIKRHTKRLQKELKKINHELTLSEAQNMFSHILGMKDYHELKQVLKIEDENLSQKSILKNPKTLLDILDESDKLRFSIDFVQKHLDSFFKNGDIQIIMEYYKSDNQEIKNYIKDNAFSFLQTASCSGQDFLSNFILEEKLVDLTVLPDQEIESWFYLLITNNLKFFEYIFYTLKIPNKLDQDLVGKLIHRIVETKNLKSLKRFLSDSRVSFQKNFFWNKTYPAPNSSSDSLFDFCALNKACSQGDLNMVKYLIEKEKLIPLNNGSTVQRACLSGNLSLVKYLIEEKKAEYNYYRPEMMKDSPKSLRDRFLNSQLDTSTLSSSLMSKNLDLVKYLIFDKKLKVDEHDNLLVQTAFIENSPHYLYMMEFAECKKYLENNAQKIFNEIINKYESINRKNRGDNQKIQLQIVKYLYDNYQIIVKDIPYKSNNPKLITYLKNIKN